MFIARQPIFTKNKKIYGYELLFRNNMETTHYTGISATSSTAQVLGSLYEQGIESIVGRGRAFVNFDYDFIMSEAIQLIDPKTLVIEVLETVEVDQPLIERLVQLKKKGFIIALDDFEIEKSKCPLLHIADMIKWDIMITPLDTLTEVVDWALRENKLILAEKVETEEEFRKAKAMGFQLFQGYFFSKPKIVGHKGGKNASKVHYSLILKEIRKEEPSFTKIAEIIETDVNLSYRLIRVSSHRKDEELISSILKALQRMGLKRLKRWINVLMLQDISQDKPLELMRTVLIRSKFAEFIAQNSSYKNRTDEVALTGLFSMLDTMLETTMKDALHGMDFTEDIVSALVYGEGELKSIFELIYHYEQANWKMVMKQANIVGINRDKLSKGYLQAVKWTTKVFETLY